MAHRQRPEPRGRRGARDPARRGRSRLIRINLLTEARAAAAKKKGPALPTGAKLNNLLLIGGLALGLIYIGTMFLVLSSKRRDLDQKIGQAKEEVARLQSIIDEVK